jgi:hypothetical protein
MSAWNEEMLLALAPTPWQPLSVREKQRDPLSPRWRLGLLAAVVLAHALALFGLLALLEKREREQENPIVVDFIDEPGPQPVEVPNETITIHRPTTSPKPRPKPKPAPKAEHGVEPLAPTRVRHAAAVDIPMQAVESPPRKGTDVQLYNPDGSLRVPGDMLDKLDRQFGDQREFSFQIPHLDDAQKLFYRNPALVYEGTRFDKYYTPDKDALTALLDKAVEATTKQVKVKVPGTSGEYIVCTVSMLALGGSCGVLVNGADWNGPQDDPDTLSAAEQKQCAAWWEKIVHATTQDAWRKTRKLYEESCNKPLERLPSG